VPAAKATSPGFRGRFFMRKGFSRWN